MYSQYSVTANITAAVPALLTPYCAYCCRRFSSLACMLLTCNGELVFRQVCAKGNPRRMQCSVTAHIGAVVQALLACCYGNVGERACVSSSLLHFAFLFYSCE